MSIIYKISIVLVVFAIFGCKTEDAEKKSFIEEVPIFETAKFDTIQVSEKLISIVPSAFSIKLTVGEKVFFTASNLFKEQHVSIEELRYATDLKASIQKKDSLFTIFAESQMESFQKTLKENNGFSIAPTSEVDKMKTIRYVGSGRSFGFPMKKHFFIRFYNYDSAILKVSSWSVDSVEMNRIAKIFELSLETKKGN